jgi:hypothetical protein
MNHIRLATPEEVETIRLESDLDPSCKVLALDTAVGTAKAVIRLAVEVDPAFYPEGFGIKQIAMFTHDIENCLWAQGALSYYFNVNPADEKWVGIVKSWGAEQVSKQPELRFKKVL